MPRRAIYGHNQGGGISVEKEYKTLEFCNQEHYSIDMINSFRDTWLKDFFEKEFIWITMITGKEVKK